MKEQKKTEEKKNVKRPLIIYDLVIFIIASVLLLILYRGRENLSATGIIEQMILAGECIFIARLVGNIYRALHHDVSFFTTIDFFETGICL